MSVAINFSVSAYFIPHRGNAWCWTGSQQSPGERQGGTLDSSGQHLFTSRGSLEPSVTLVMRCVHVHGLWGMSKNLERTHAGTEKHGETYSAQGPQFTETTGSRDITVFLVLITNLRGSIDNVSCINENNLF